MNPYKKTILLALITGNIGFVVLAMDACTTDLHEAAQKGDIDEVNGLLESIQDPKQRATYLLALDESSETALHKAVKAALAAEKRFPSRMLTSAKINKLETMLEKIDVARTVVRTLILHYKQNKIEIPYHVLQPLIIAGGLGGYCIIDEESDLWPILGQKEETYQEVQSKIFALERVLYEKESLLRSYEQRMMAAQEKGASEESTMFQKLYQRLKETIDFIGYRIEGLDDLIHENRT